MTGSTCDGPSHTYDDNGNYSVTIAVTDANNGTGSNSATHEVTNVPPTATLSNDGPVAEGSAATVSFTIPSDPSNADTTAGFHYAFACDGSSLDAATYANSGTDASTTCTFDDGPSTHDVVARIIDKDGGYTEYTTTVTVTNVPPTATLSNDGPVAEGSAATVSFTNQSDPSNADTAAGFHYAFACDGSSLDSATYANSNADASTTCTFDDGPSTHDVVARVIDKDGGYTEHTTTVTVTNVAPAATISAPSSVNEGDTFTVSLDNPTDPSRTDTAAGFTYTFDCGDGTGVQDTNTTASISCVAHDVASQTVTATITDKDGGTSSYSSVVTVNNVAPSVGAITAPLIPLKSAPVSTPVPPSPIPASGWAIATRPVGTGVMARPPAERSRSQPALDQ